MEDLIKRSDAIKAIEELRKEPHWLHDGDDYRVCGLSEAEDAIERLPSADRPQEWIPCSERLPNNFNEDEMVLATTDVDGLRVILMLAVDVERFYLKGYVSAWMPSPKPWEGADDE